MSQSYTPANDTRYRRDRSPPPRTTDRYEVPRGPRAFESTRGPGQFVPRGRGGFAGRGDYRNERGDYRSEFRERDLIRDNRDSSPPGRSWRDRDFRDRRPSPPGRAGPGAFRDFRDAAPREADIGRGRRDSRDATFAGPPQFTNFRDNAPLGRGRAGFTRGRGRGDWEGRGRGREFPEERETFRQRSRSPRDDHWARNSPRDNREFDRRDEYRPVPREVTERLEREPQQDRFRREPFPPGNESRRTSAPSTRPTTPGVAPSTHPFAVARQLQDQDRHVNNLRRVSTLNNVPPHVREIRQENFKPDLLASRVEASRGRYASEASSPVHAPQVPAFGTFAAPPFKAPSTGDAPWNVWRAPADPKPQQQPITNAPSISPAKQSPMMSKEVELPGQTFERMDTERLPASIPPPDVEKPSSTTFVAPPIPVPPRNDSEPRTAPTPRADGQQPPTKIQKLQAERQSPKLAQFDHSRTISNIPKKDSERPALPAPISELDHLPSASIRAEAERVPPAPKAEAERKHVPAPKTEVERNLPPASRVEVERVPPPVTREEVNRIPPPEPVVEVERISPPASRLEVERIHPPASSMEVDRISPPAPKVDAERPPLSASRGEAERIPPPASRSAAERIPPPAPRAEVSRIPPPAPRVDVDRVPPPSSRAEAERILPPSARVEAERIPPPVPKPEVERVPPKAPKADRMQEHITGASRNVIANMNQSIRPMETSTSPNLPALNTQSFRRDIPEVSQRTAAELMRSPPIPPRQQTFASIPAHGSNRLDGPPFGVKSHIPMPRTSPTIPSAFVAPLGPRSGFTAPSSTKVPSSTNIGSNIPKGPRADRMQPQAPSRVPTGPSAGRQWNRPTGPTPTFKSGTIIPAKRDAQGDEKDRQQYQSQRENTSKSLDSTSVSPMQPRSATSMSQERSFVATTQAQTVAGHEEDDILANDGSNMNLLPTTRKETVAGTVSRSPRSQPLEGLVDEDDGMDLDDVDFEENEVKYENQKAELESQLIDLGTRHLRGATPLEQLAYLGRMAIDDIRLSNSEPTKKKLLTPKVEEADIVDEASSEDVSPTGTPNVGSPELRALPYLCREPLTPLSELDALHENFARQESTRDFVAAELARNQDRRSRTEEALRGEYARLYKTWKRYTNELDKAKGDDNSEIPVVIQAAAAIIPEVVIAAAVTMESRRGRGGNNTEYDLQKVIQESVNTAHQETLNREKEALASKPDLEKEAVIPDLLSETTQRARAFQDKSQLKAPELAAKIFELLPPRDDFTLEEHKILVESYKENPKQFGFIARDLPGRTYKDCINHYYATKWNKEYKPPRDKRRRKGRLKGGFPAPGRSKANALISNRTDVYDGDEVGAGNVAVTDSGRPKRAAAPTFGEKETDDPTGLLGGRKGAKGDVSLDPGTEKPGRKPRTIPKEKGQRKARGPTVTRHPSLSPEKLDIEAKRPPLDLTSKLGLGAVELDAVSSLAALHSGQVYNLSVDNGQQYPGDFPNQQLGMNAGVDAYKYGQPPKVGGLQASSYWSKQEERAFPHHLSHFGTDWQAIAQEMGTKTQTMVKNYYNRLVTSGHADVEEMANRADQKRTRGEKIGPPPTPTMQAKRRNEPIPPTAPRAIAPSMEFVDASEASPQVDARIMDQGVQKQQYGPMKFSPAPTPTQIPKRMENVGRPPEVEPPAHVANVEIKSQPTTGSRPLAENFRSDTSRPPSMTPFLQPVSLSQRPTVAEHNQRSEVMHERAEHRIPPAAYEPLWQPRSRPDPARASLMDRQSGNQISTKHQYGSPQQQFNRPPLESTRERPVSDIRVESSHKNFQQEVQPESLQARYMTEHPMQRLHSASSMYSNNTQLPPTPPVMEEKRPAVRPLPANNAPSLSVPKQEPRRTSNLMSILNADPVESKDTRRPPMESTRLATTPQPGYPGLAPPPRPMSQTGRRDPFPSGYPAPNPAPSYGPIQSSVPSRHESNSRDTTSYASNRQDWLQRQPYTSVAPTPPIGPAYSMEKPAEPHNLHHRSSLSGLTSRNNPSPPPAHHYGYGPSRDTPVMSQHHPPPPPPPPPQYQSVQSHHQNSINALHANPYGGHSTTSKSNVNSNQQVHAHNSGISAFPPQHPQQQAPQRQPTEPGAIRSESGYRPRQPQPEQHMPLTREETNYLSRDRSIGGTISRTSSTSGYGAHPPPPPPPPPVGPRISRDEIPHPSRQDLSLHQQRNYRTYSSGGPRDDNRSSLSTTQHDMSRLQQQQQPQHHHDSRFGGRPPPFEGMGMRPSPGAGGAAGERGGPPPSSSAGLSLAEMTQRITQGGPGSGGMLGMRRVEGGVSGGVPGRVGGSGGGGRERERERDRERDGKKM